MSQEREKPSDPVNGENPDQKPGDKKPSRGDYIWASIFTGLAAYGTVELGIRLGHQATPLIDTWLNRALSSPQPRPERPIFPLDEKGNRLLPADKDLYGFLKNSLGTYYSWQVFARENLQPLLHDRQPEETAQLLKQVGKNFVLEGVTILQTAWLSGHSNDQLIIDHQESSLWINGEHFDLENRYETQLASAWIQTRGMKLEAKLNGLLLKESGELDEFTEEELSLRTEEFQEDSELLTWLKQREAPITISEESFVLFPRGEMVSTARVFQAVDRLGFEIPKSLEWCPSTCLDRLDRKEKVINKEGLTEETTLVVVGATDPIGEGIKLENEAGVGALAHEIGHLVSRKDNLLAKFGEMRGFLGQAPQEEQLTHFSSHAMRNSDEDFAETFGVFLMDGDYFRSLLEELKVHHPKAFKTLQQKYDFMRNEVWGGEEFSSGAKVRNQYLVEERKQEFSGIKWSVEERALELSPNPNVWSGKRFLYQEFPILNKDKIERMGVWFEYQPETHSYVIQINNSRLVSKATFFPFPGDNRVLVEENGVKLSGGIEKGSDGLIKIIPSPLNEAANSVRLRVGSFSPVQIEQHRKIRDNDWEDFGVLLRNDPGIVGNKDNHLYNGENILILDGPKEAFYPYSGENERFWQVKSGWGDSGWVPERWIGAELKTK